MAEGGRGERRPDLTLRVRACPPQAKYLYSLGLRGAYSGLGPRLVMTSAMTSIQFTIYEGVRSALGVAGLPPPPKPVILPA